MRPILIAILFFASILASAQVKSGTIKVRKAKSVKGLYVLDDGDYYKTKLYVRFFDNNAAVFLRAACTPKQANDSTARLLYTYRKSPAVYKVVSDSVFIEGTENKAAFLYRGILAQNRLKVRKISLSKETAMVFKKVM